MAQFTEQYSESYSAGVITAGSSETFGAAETAHVHRDRYGSANSLILSNFSAETMRIDLDGLTSRTIGVLPSNGTFIISPEDGIFFNFVRLVNVSTTDTSADEIKVKIARAKRVAS